MYDGIAYSALWKLMAWLPPFLIRWKFTKEALAARVRIDVRNRPHAVQINGGEISDATTWLTIQNAGYFPVQLDRLTLTLTLGGVPLDFYHLTRVSIPVDKMHELFLRDPLNPGLISHIKRNLKNGEIVSASIDAEFNSDIHNFSVRVPHISGISYRAINFD